MSATDPTRRSLERGRYLASRVTTSSTTTASTSLPGVCAAITAAPKSRRSRREPGCADSAPQPHAKAWSWSFNAGEAAALSGPNLVSGLARVGGGSALHGIATVSSFSALLACGGMCIALRDKPYHSEDERRARKTGRYGAAGGAVLGVGTSIYAVGAIGLPGYSATGLSSGLAQLGAALGGGMAQGVAVIVLLPIIFAVILGYVLYRVSRNVLAPRSPPADC